MRLSSAILPWCASLTAVLLVAGIYLAMFVAPPDYQQGESARIMFVHVPSAWMALFVYATMAVASASALIWKHPLADLTAKSCAPIGAGFTAMALLTGALWGQPMWGTWWVWDARLTSVLILFFLYLGYMALWRAIEDPAKAARAAALLAIVGAINLPIIKFSVEWWEYTAPAGKRVETLRLDHPRLDAVAALRHGDRLFDLLRHGADLEGSARTHRPQGTCHAAVAGVASPNRAPRQVAPKPPPIADGPIWTPREGGLYM